MGGTISKKERLALATDTKRSITYSVVNLLLRCAPENCEEAQTLILFILSWMCELDTELYALEIYESVGLTQDELIANRWNYAEKLGLGDLEAYRFEYARHLIVKRQIFLHFTSPTPLTADDDDDEFVVVLDRDVVVEIPYKAFDINIENYRYK